MSTNSVDKAIFRETNTTFSLHSFEDDKQALASLIEQAEKQVSIMSHLLCPSIFNTALVIDACIAFCLKNHQTKICILVAETAPLTRISHRLLTLSHQYSSSIFFKKINPAIALRDDDFVCIDRSAYFQLPNHQHYEGLCNFSDAQRTATFLNIFNDAWERSETDPELRSLLL